MGSISDIHFIVRTLQMRTTCAICYDLFKYSMNRVRLLGERLITSIMVTWAPRRDRHTALVTRRTFSHGFCSRTFKTLSRIGRTCHSYKQLYDLVAFLPNQRTFHASPNPLGVPQMSCAPKRLMGLQLLLV